MVKESSKAKAVEVHALGFLLNKRALICLPSLISSMRLYKLVKIQFNTSETLPAPPSLNFFFLSSVVKILHPTSIVSRDLLQFIKFYHE